MRASATIAVVVSAVFLAAGCRGQTSDETPVIPLRNMHFQQRYNDQAESPFFQDHRTMRPLIADTVARGSYIDDEHVALGLEMDANGTPTGYVARIPDAVVAHAGGLSTLVERGQQRFGIYCTPCHGRAGDGNGIVYVRGQQGGGYNFPQPATLHQDRIRRAPDGQIYATITNGVRNMAGYAAQIPVQDRWAIVAYVRALELSQASNAGATQ